MRLTGTKMPHTCDHAPESIRTREVRNLFLFSHLLSRKSFHGWQSASFQLVAHIALQARPDRAQNYFFGLLPRRLGIRNLRKRSGRKEGGFCRADACLKRPASQGRIYDVTLTAATPRRSAGILSQRGTMVTIPDTPAPGRFGNQDLEFLAGFGIVRDKVSLLPRCRDVKFRAVCVKAFETTRVFHLV
jgi:hypothetical protein